MNASNLLDRGDVGCHGLVCCYPCMQPFANVFFLKFRDGIQPNISDSTRTTGQFWGGCTEPSDFGIQEKGSCHIPGLSYIFIFCYRPCNYAFITDSVFILRYKLTFLISAELAQPDVRSEMSTEAITCMCRQAARTGGTEYGPGYIYIWPPSLDASNDGMTADSTWSEGWLQLLAARPS